MASVAVVVATLVAVAPAPSAQAASPCGPAVNAIVCENQQPGTEPTVWDIEGAGDPTIQGFATDISVNAGSTVDFKIDTDAADYSIDIYRTGWYQGRGARLITSVEPSALLPQVQDECISDMTTELYDCGTWDVSASWAVPSGAVSGVYLALLSRGDTGGQSHIIFIVRNDGNSSDVVFQTSDPTWHAYNRYGGSDFYQGAANGRAYKISYNRPFATREGVTARDFYFSSEYATVRFMERNGYDVSYIAGVDTDRRGAELRNHEVFLSVGHDEYWSGAQRANIEAARDAGVNLQFLTGNEGYWRTRYEPSADPTHTGHRTLVSYKETWGNAVHKDGGKIDPAAEWTGTWRDPRFAGADEGGHSPENALTGTLYLANHTDLAVTVSGTEGKLRLWRGAGLSGLGPDTKVALAPHTVGYESDEVPDNGHTPAGLIRLSTTVGPAAEYLTDYGNSLVEGTTRHHLTLYRAPSDALVFSAGSVQWGWGLDQEHDGNGAPADARIQQAQVNLLADMGAQPGSLMEGLQRATETTDASPPVTTITAPAEGASVAHGAMVTVTGTAADVGGVVAGVEVSTDGGSSWYPATGTTSWTYSYPQQGLGHATIMARAIDDSARYSPTGVTRTVSVTGASSVFGQYTPALASSSDEQSIELGLRFIPSEDGYASGVRFYKGAANTGQHTGSLWSAQGGREASVVFQNETATGWQTALFTEPVSLLAGQQYTVSYTAPRGGYAFEEWYWPYKARATTPLQVPTQSGAGAAGVYGWPGALPTTVHHDSNYFVDVVFEAATESPVRLTAQSPTPGASSVALDTVVSTRFTRAVVASSVGLTVTAAGGEEAAGTVSYDEATRELRYAPFAALAANTTYTVSVTATPADGSAFEPGAAWTFTTAGDGDPNACPCTLYRDTDVPSIASVADSARVTLGTAFSVSEPGYISGVRFYKGTANTGTHVGALWDAATQRQLATVTFEGESATGWQTALFDAPVAVSPGSSYLVSYLAPRGGYSATPGAFAAPVRRGPLQVPAEGGAYTYADGFPDRPSTTSYFVDPIFVRAVAGPSLRSTVPVAGATGVDVATQISATYSEPLTAVPAVTVTAGSTAVAGSTTLSADGLTVTFAPADDLPRQSLVVVEIAAPSSAGGAGLSRAWSFRTEDADAPTTFDFFGENAPVPVNAAEGASVELGMRFQSNVAGRVTGIRFFKVAGDTGTHTATLWGPDGRALTTVDFEAESPEGWQRAQLAAPVDIAAGQLYTVSYLSPQGRYAFAGDYFTAAPVTAGPLTAPSPENGVFRYGGGGVMPTQSWRSTNYFVDVDFSTATGSEPSLTLVQRSPEGAAVATDAAVTATFSADAPSGTLTVASAAGAVAGVSEYSAATRTVTFRAAAPLAHATTYTATARIAGQALQSWQFTTVPPQVEGVVGTLFGDAQPDVAAVTDDAPVEVGTAFTVDHAGWATAIRFFKGPGNGGTHVGRLWNAVGEQQAEVVFENETASGWQRAALSTPVQLTPGATYVVSYLAPGGRYAATSGYFAAPVTRGFITGLGVDNGRFRYGSDGGFPTQSWGASAYFVDAEVTFGATPPAAAPTPTPTPTVTPTPTPTPTVTPTPTPTPSVTPTPTPTPSVTPTPTPTPSVTPSPTPSVTPTPTPTPTPTVTPTPTPQPAVATLTVPARDETEVAPTATVAATFDSEVGDAALAVSSATGVVAGTATYDSGTRTVTFVPEQPFAWATRYDVVATADGGVTGGSWSFTTSAEPPVLDVASMFADGTPQNPAWNDDESAQVATRFTVSVAGEATSIRFYKGAANTGVHTGYLWRADGVKLAEVDFVTETAQGWQEAQLSTPVVLEPGVEYRVGLHSSAGRYAVDLGALAQAQQVGPFAIPASGGAYTYSRAFPSETSPHNYWIDVVFDESG